jgi:pimeloyl-ACP methyl ester carboxylesterase
MGGALALEMAKRGRAHSVVGLAPAGGWTPGDGEAPRLRRFFARQLRVTKALAPRLPRIVSRPRARRLAFRDVLRRGDVLTPSEALNLSLSSIRCEIADRALEALRADRGLTLDELERINCPVLVASPQFDRILPPARHAPRLLREIPGAEARTLAGCGHVPMWDDTETVVNVICEFIARTAGAAALPAEPSLAQAPAGA